jgi:predicted TIM-barrel fold metal-dependent hydrolase
MHKGSHRLLMIAAIAAAMLLQQRGLAADALPFKMFDAHTHLITPDFDRYPLTPPPTLPGVPPNPALANLPERIRNNPTNVERVLELWNANGVGAGAGVQYRTAYNVDNTYLLDSAARFPQRVVPIVLLAALDPNTPYILRSMVRDAGAAGARFSAAADAKTGAYHWLNSAAALKTWAAANELGAVIVLMPLPANSVDPKVLQAIAQNARQFPNVKVVLDHFGWMPAEGAPNFGITSDHAALKDQRNIYFKFSSIVIEQQLAAKNPVADFLRHAVDVYGADHILWGSDLGNSTESYAEMVHLAVKATSRLTPRERKWVLRDTGMAVHVAGGRGKRRQAARD